MHKYFSKQTSKDKILEIVHSNQEKQYSISDFVEQLGVSRQAITTALNDLRSKNYIIKIGTSPRVFFQYNKNNNFWISSSANKNLKDKEYLPEDILSNGKKDIIKNNFYKISPDGIEYKGMIALEYFCKNGKREISKTIEEYVKIYNEYNQHRNHKGFIHANQKIKEAFAKEGMKTFIDDVYYIDFYNYPIFGKTKLGQQVLYAKSSANIKLINKTVNDVVPKILKFIKEYNIESVAFIPPTINRSKQFMKILEKGIKTDLPKINLIKSAEIRVAQKTINKMSDRIINAENTIFITNDSKNLRFKNVLLIDDAVGSGATFNVIAKKIKDYDISNKVIGLSLVGSSNGFEVLNEV